MTDQNAQPGPEKPDSGGVSRRSLFRAAGVGAAVVGGGSLLEACSSSIKGASGGSTATASSAKSLTIGWIHPLTGALAGFGAPDNWVIEQIKQTDPYKNGFKIGGKTYTVTIKSYDSQSSVTMAGNLAKQANTLGTPLICSNVPWEAYYANLGGNPAPGKSTLKPKFSVMYFLGAEHLVEAFIPMWNKIGAAHGNNHIVAAAFPNDPDGKAFSAVFPEIAKGAGYTIDLSAAYTDGLQNYSSMISKFKSSGDDFFTNVPLPPDFAVMWKQSVQQGFKPKLATVAKVRGRSTSPAPRPRRPAWPSPRRSASS